MKSIDKKILANKLLFYFELNEIVNCENTFDCLKKFSDVTIYPMYDVWKAFQLLRDLGNIELNCPNGRKGFHIVSYNRITNPCFETTKYESEEKMSEYVEHCKIPIGEKGEFKSRIEYDKNNNPWIIVDKKKKEIMDECTAKIKKSQGNSGYYILIEHEGKSVMALGINPEAKFYNKNKHKYDIVPAIGATMSFNVYER